ncbi:MAG: hypothetical protein ACD_78C00070G0006 [uncultured bacterium (gcode 4)]|uniref:Uncharacterized protein n=1 Tax=uncultured bacterium (gcode 4) TaxID=1234023 RepID=K1XJ46_9BACT|nr:MAG: hypothetical protein ACD_78C00070G0006 [uncultured bacterium (gcode 4)]HBB27093.1 hypothetical protein [Candidatus Gracilibacteria bacterium]
MLSKEEAQTLKDAGLSFEQIQDLSASEEEFENTGVSYDLDTAFVMVKNNIFTKHNKECTR